MSPQPRGLISPEHQARLRAAQEAKAAADVEIRAAVVAALLAGGSVREVAAFMDMSTNTVERWGRDGGWPSAEQKAAREATRARNAEWRAFQAQHPDGPPS